MGPTAGKQGPSDPPFWPETPFMRTQPPLKTASTYIYDRGLLLLLPAGAASHVQESHLAPQPCAIGHIDKFPEIFELVFKEKL